VATDPTAHVIGYASEVTDADPLETVPVKFRQYLGIMRKEAADALPEY